MSPPPPLLSFQPLVPAECGGGAVAALPGGVLRPRGRAHRPPALPVRGGLVNRAVNESSRNFTVPLCPTMAPPCPQ